MRVVEVAESQRRELELELRASGYVPIDHRDAVVPWQQRVLPDCSVEEQVEGVRHGRVVWAHPGPSGVDPRALAALALVRVADGMGLPALDSPMDVVEALVWLQTGHVEPWLIRTEHRVLVPSAEGACLVDHERCVTHLVPDQALQDVADAFGDESYAACAWTGADWPRRWTGPSEHVTQAELTCGALAVTRRLGTALREGLRGATAWDVARHGVTLENYAAWLEKDATPEQLSAWLAHDQLFTAVLRPTCVPPLIDLPDVPTPQRSADRGLHWYAQWKLDRAETILTCSCGGRDVRVPCRSCAVDGGHRRGVCDWSSYALIAVYPGLRRPARLPRVPCGVRSCRTSLATSAAESKGAGQ